ncbi:hypothetical protein ACT3CE_17970 [Marinifilum sp. RC60d5]|uniref:hypothetical protein n=1 Tax=Marinifilum sp. RC60d5 TaxID=3458414 RepID=UPI0040374FFC
MKKFLPIAVLLLLCFGCAPPKKVNEKSTSSLSPKQEKELTLDKQFAPGTCSLLISEYEVISEDNQLWLKGNVDKLNGYGAGFNEVIQKNQVIKIRISKEQSEKIDNTKTLSCIILSIKKMNQSSTFELQDLK